MPATKKFASSEATEDEVRHICNGTLDQVQAIDMVRAFDPGAWVRIAFDARSVASILRGEPFLKAKLQSGQHSQLVFARTFSDLKNCQVSTVMEHLSTFLRTKFEIDVPPDFLSVYLPHNVPLFAVGINFSVRCPGWRLDGFCGKTYAVTFAGHYHYPGCYPVLQWRKLPFLNGQSLNATANVRHMGPVGY